MRIEQNHPIDNQLPFIRIWVEGRLRTNATRVF